MSLARAMTSDGVDVQYDVALVHNPSISSSLQNASTSSAKPADTQVTIYLIV
jgi:hypothetical protein